MYSYIRTGTLQRRLLFSTAFCLLANAALAQQTSEETYPTRPIRLIVTSAAGGGADILARLFAHKLTERFRQQVVVDNRPGAGGIIGAELTAKATPNGYTYALVSGSHTVFPAMHRKLPYDTVGDFAPVTNLVSLSYLLVASPSLPAQSVGELIAAAKAAPRSILYASNGNGSTAHLSAEVLKTLAGIDIVHVPYKGAAAALSALLAREVALGFYSVALTTQHIKSGRLKVLATTGEKRVLAFPDLPTMAEAGIKDYEFVSWLGILAPAATPRQIITRMHRELITVLAQAEVRQQLADMRYDPVGNSPEEFGRDLRRELDKWAKVVKDSGAKVE
ncbi:MAG: tripartite tricarboxylate transporter substrate binding protein [Betaproteobacteria bacterium]|nr:tripartite tricarboxylate transporter substrate binding protein [Betaproteobacteria bacterium]